MFAYCGNNPVLYRDSYGTRHEISAGGGGYPAKNRAGKSVPSISNNFGGAIVVDEEVTTDLLYLFVATIETGVGQRKSFDNGNPLNSYWAISDGILGIPEYSVGVNANFEGYGGSVQIGSNYLLSLDLKNISHEIGIDNPVGRIYYKYSYANEHGTYAYTKVSLNVPEICAVLLLAYYFPYALPVVGAFAASNS